MAADGTTSENAVPAVAETTVTSMFSSLLQEIKQMNENIQALSESIVPSGDEADDLDELEEPDAGNGGIRADPNNAEDPSGSANLTGKQADSDLLADIALDLDVSEQTGGDISQGLAGIVTSLLKEKLSDDKTQSKIEKYRRPANVEGLRVPRVNPLIWNQLPAPVRTNDSKAQKSQNALVGSIVAVARATDLVLSQTGQNKELVTALTDAIALALQSYHDMNTSRRQAMKKDLHKDYAALCSSTTVEPSSEYLFGDISKLAKDIAEANKLTRKMRPSHYGPTNRTNNRYHGGGRRHGSHQNNRFSPYQRGRNDFLSKGHPPKSRLKKEGAAKQNQFLRYVNK